LLFIIEHIFSACIYRSAIPTAWKNANVTPVYKKGLKTDPSNYRPIAVTSVVPKIFERILYEQLVKHLEINHLLLDSQYGYRTGMSTSHAILDVTEKVRSLSSHGEFVGLLLIDLSKAFDCVNHNLLLNMLPLYGFDEFSCNLIRSFLTERSQRVKVNGVFSTARQTVCGVPQGSLLGPVLFDVYVNFLSRTVRSHIVQYADDVAVIAGNVRYNELKDTLGNDLRAIMAYFRDLGLQLNVSKTEYMVFGRPTGDAGLRVGPTLIEPVASLNYLGVKIDDRLTFDQQNTIVLNKLKRANFLIRSIRTNITLRIANQLLHSLAYSHHDYASIVWSQSPNSRLSIMMEKQHRFCLKSVYQKGWLYPSDALYRLAQQPQLCTRRKSSLCKLVHSVLKAAVPVRFLGYFEISNTARGRAALRLVVPRALRPTNFVRNAVSFRGVSAWNSLPRDVALVHTTQSFSRAIKKFYTPAPL
jgi:hypothetical protein